MITTKQWKAFNEYRDKIHKEVTESEDWKKTGERIKELNNELKPVTVKKIGFWGNEYEETYRLDLVDMWRINNLIDFAFLHYKLMLCKVPPKTVEACLDWLTIKNL